MNESSTPPRKHKVCPHCGKEIDPLVRKPRDLGLLMNCLIYRVPIEAEMTETWIEVARKHCRMKPERLAELRTQPHARHWSRMLVRRAARLAYFKQHGCRPHPWEPLLPGEPDRSWQLAALRQYRKGGLAKLKARMRKSPNTQSDKLANRYFATRKIRSKSRKSAALDDVLARFVTNTVAQTGKITLAEYERYRTLMLPDDELPRRFRRGKKQPPATGSTPGTAGENARGEDSVEVPPPESPHDKPSGDG